MTTNPSSTFGSPDATNSTSSFSLASPDGYLQLAPFGLFPHPRGLQNVDPAALEGLVKNFKSFFSRLGRRFAGIPFYVGHPDAPGYENVFTDRKAYGWIMDLQVRDDGLYGRPKWSAAGRDLLANGHYKFLSPYWHAEKIGSRENRPVFRPTSLISVGLTNEPNLPVLPLANSESPSFNGQTLIGNAMSLSPNSEFPTGNAETQEEDPSTESKKISDSEGEHARPRGSQSASSPTGSPPEQPIESASINPAPDSEPPRLFQSDCTLADIHGRDVFHPRPSNSSATTSSFDLRLSHLTDLLSNCHAQIADLHARLINSLLDNAIAQARILPVERPHWETALTSNFVSASVELANAKPKLNTTALTDTLVPLHTPQRGPEKQKRILTLVNEKMHHTGLNYDRAWLETKSEHPELS